MDYKTNKQLKEYTTLKIGGPAARFYEPQSIADIQEILEENKQSDARIFVLGNGSNVLFEDEGFDGWIIHMAENMAGMERLGSQDIRVMAGVRNADLAEELASMGLGGFEFASGIPGTVGGAVIMNAGAYDGEMRDVITNVGYLDEDGMLHELSGEALGFGYRHSWFTDNFGIVVYADFHFEPKEEQSIRAKMQDLHDRRHSKQPMDKASAGSTFKRPKNGYASALIHESGLQGLSVGDAMVSTKHAGFLINDGNATCKDFLELVSQVQKRVKEDSGIDLEMEVHFVPKSK